jgi:hypothetical protein
MIGRVIAEVHGGYTHLGKIEGDKYFVANKGVYSEVTIEEWKFLQQTERVFGDWWSVGASIGFVVFVVMGVLLPPYIFKSPPKVTMSSPL